MRIVVLGCHSPFPGIDQATPGYLLQADGKNILLDCGTGVLARLQRYVPVRDLDAVVISHLHPDHSADLIPLGFAAMLASSQGELGKAIPVFMPPGGSQLFLELVNRLGNLAGQLTRGLTFTDYGPGELELAGLTARLFATTHAMQCHGIYIQSREGRFAYTADTGYTPELAAQVKDADVLLAEAGGVSPEQAKATNHLLPQEAAKLAAEANARILVLTHFLPNTDPAVLRKVVEPIYPGTLHIAEEDKVIVL